jgi:hypothetical protein
MDIDTKVDEEDPLSPSASGRMDRLSLDQPAMSSFGSHEIDRSSDAGVGDDSEDPLLLTAYHQRSADDLW